MTLSASQGGVTAVGTGSFLFLVFQGISAKGSA